MRPVMWEGMRMHSMEAYFEELPSLPPCSFSPYRLDHGSILLGMTNQKVRLLDIPMTLLGRSRGAVPWSLMDAIT